MKLGKEPQISVEEKTQTMKTEMSKTTLGGKEQNSRGNRGGVSNSAARRENSNPKEMQMMERVVKGENMQRALRRVEKNKGSAGVDNMTVRELCTYLNKQWPRIKGELLNDRYKPQPVLRVEIPKPSGGVRQLGIPTSFCQMLWMSIPQIMFKRSLIPVFLILSIQCHPQI